MDDLTPQKKPDKREYTFMVIPHCGERMRSWSISIKTLKLLTMGVGICLGVFVVLLGWQMRVVYQASRDAAELQALRAGREAQTQKIRELAAATNELQEKVQEIDKLETEVKRTLNQDTNGQTSRRGIDRTGRIAEGRGGGSEPLSAELLGVQISNLKQEMDYRRDSLTDLREQLQERNQRLAASPTHWPTDGGTITSRFGGRSSPWGIGSSYHPGVDIANDHGSPIYAAAAGIVIESGWNGGYGRFIEIDHGYGITTAYAHNSGNSVDVGQQVRKGQLIGYIGNTGNSTGSHVHFEVRVNGVQVDPMRFLEY